MTPHYTTGLATIHKYNLQMEWMDILIDDNRGIAPIQFSLWHSLSNILRTVSFSEWNVPFSSVARNILVLHDWLGTPLLYLPWTFLSSASESDSFKGWVKEENLENLTSVAYYLLFLVWFFPFSSSLRVLLMQLSQVDHSRETLGCSSPGLQSAVWCWPQSAVLAHKQTSHTRVWAEESTKYLSSRLDMASPALAHKHNSNTHVGILVMEKISCLWLWFSLNFFYMSWTSGRFLIENHRCHHVGKETEIRGRMFYFNQLWWKSWHHVIQLVWRPYISTTYRWNGWIFW